MLVEVHNTVGYITVRG